MGWTDCWDLPVYGDPCLQPGKQSWRIQARNGVALIVFEHIGISTRRKKAVAIIKKIIKLALEESGQGICACIFTVPCM